MAISRRMNPGHQQPESAQTAWKFPSEKLQNGSMLGHPCRRVRFQPYRRLLKMLGLHSFKAESLRIRNALVGDCA